MSAVLNPPLAAAPAWRPALAALAGVWLLLGVLYADTVTGMVSIWLRSETFAHALLVPPIALWLVWRQREALARIEPAPQPLLLLGVLAFALMWLLADLVLVNAAAQFAWVAMLVLSVPALLGWRVTQQILFPLLFLFFAVPIGDFMLQPMMDWTADFTVWALRGSGVPVYREGLNFVIPSGRWSVVEACSGVRYLIASFMVGSLFAYLNYRSHWRRAVFMAVSILVPIVANWVRAYGIVMLGHLSGNTIAVGVDHLLYGWVFFGVVVLVMFVIGARWSEPPVAEAASSVLAVSRPGRSAPPAARWAVALALAAVMAAPHLGLQALQRWEQGRPAPVLALPAELGAGWVLAQSRLPAEDEPARFDSYRPRFQNPAAEQAGIYAGPAGRVGVHLVYYRGQAGDSKLVTSVNVLVRSEDFRWNPVSMGSARLQTPDGVVPWRTARVLGQPLPGEPRAQLTVWRSIWQDGHWQASDVRAKVVGALTRLRGRGDEGAALVLWADHENPAEAEALLQAFARDNLPALQALLRQVQAGN